MPNSELQKNEEGDVVRKFAYQGQNLTNMTNLIEVLSTPFLAIRVALRKLIQSKARYLFSLSNLQKREYAINKAEQKKRT